MKCNPIGPNQTEITLGNGDQIFFSYRTPVAAFVSGMGYIRTETKYSPTTSKHINKWLGSIRAKEVPQEVIDQIG